ncbi:hypothetical protein AMTRI_Chr13g88810 [Amborella trichopoda]
MELIKLKFLTLKLIRSVFLGFCFENPMMGSRSDTFKLQASHSDYCVFYFLPLVCIRCEIG